jgi:hypothetical protein
MSCCKGIECKESRGRISKVMAMVVCALLHLVGTLDCLIMLDILCSEATKSGVLYRT